MQQPAVTLQLVESAGPEPGDWEGAFGSFGLAAERIPSRLRQRRERRPVVIRPSMPGTRQPGLLVVAALFAYLLRARLERWLRPDADERSAVALRALFERFGGLWIKLGQLLSLRTDMLSAPMCRELSRLQFEAVGFPPAEAVAV